MVEILSNAHSIKMRVPLLAGKRLPGRHRLRPEHWEVDDRQRHDFGKVVPAESDGYPC